MLLVVVGALLLAVSACYFLLNYADGYYDSKEARNVQLHRPTPLAIFF